MSNQTLKRKLDSSSGVNVITSRSQVLNDKLLHRPDRHQLIEQGILHDSQCAPSLQYAEHALKRARLADELNSRLSNRPGPLDLIQHNILHIDTSEHPNLEQAIQGGQIPFKTTTTYRRPLIFHEYTGSPSSCKPKVTKIDSLSSASSTHQIRLAQQQLLLELTSDKQDEQQQITLSSSPTTMTIASSTLSYKKSLEQMTLAELRDLCKCYQIPSSHANKTKLIERIKQVQNQINTQDLSILNIDSTDLSNVDIISSLDMPNVNGEQVEQFATTELDEILQYFPNNFMNREDEQISNSFINLEIQNVSNDTSALNNDDLFVQMLLDNDCASLSTNASEMTFDDLFLTDLLPTSPSALASPLPRITSVDEFDAFLRDFTLNFTPHQQQEVSTPIS